MNTIKALTCSLVGVTCALALIALGPASAGLSPVLDSTFSFGDTFRAAVSFQAAELGSLSGPEMLGWQLDAIRGHQVALARFVEQHQLMLQLVCGTLFLIVLLGGANPFQALQRRLDEFVVFCSGAAWRPAMNLVLVVAVAVAGVTHLAIPDREMDRSGTSVVPAAWAAMQPLGSSGALAFASRGNSGSPSRATFQVDLSPREATIATQKSFRNWVHSHPNRGEAGRSAADLWRAAKRLTLRPNDRQGLLHVLYNSPYISQRGKAVLYLQHLAGTDQEVTLAFQDVLERNEDNGLVRSVLRALSRVRNPEVVAAVAKVAQDGNYWQVRSDAANCLASMGTDKSLQSLCQMVQSDQDPQVRLRVAEILGTYEPQEKIVEVLAQVARKDQEELVRFHAVEALGNVHTEIRVHQTTKMGKKLQDALAARILAELKAATVQVSSTWSEHTSAKMVLQNAKTAEALGPKARLIHMPVLGDDRPADPFASRIVCSGRRLTSISDIGSKYVEGSGEKHYTFKEQINKWYLSEDD